MSEDITYVGLDVHKRSISVAIRVGGEIVDEEKIPNEKDIVAKAVRRWKRRHPGSLLCAYEAGACGYALARRLEALNVECQVVAPSLIPRKAGERIKTDRRDAKKIVEYLEGGYLTPIRPPTPEQEAARDLSRAREDAVKDRMSARHRLSKFLLRHGITYAVGRKAWTVAHRNWLAKVEFDDPVSRAVFHDYRLAVAQIDARIESLDRQIEEVATSGSYRDAVGALRCFRGIDTRTAFGLVTELHNIAHFEKPQRLMAFVGLVPSESSSGDKRRRGSITKTGNGHVRRLLIEAAWHARHKPAVPAALRLRREGQPCEVVAMADKAQERLHRRYWRLTQRGKPATVAATAVARELTGFVWVALKAVA